MILFNLGGNFEILSIEVLSLDNVIMRRKCLSTKCKKMLR